MENKKYSFKEKESERKQLHEIVPLKMPFAMDFFVSNACNFKCFYCLQSNTGNGHEYFQKGSMMTFETFKRCIDNISAAGKLKILTMSGTGEPLLNPAIVEMVQYAVDMEVADSVEIVSNGALLTHEMSEKLAKAGLGRLRISLQGLNSRAYKEVSGIVLDFEKLKEEIRYFYKVRKNSILYIKVMDFMVKEEADRKRFYDDFENYCDEINIENLVPLYEDIDYSVSGSDFKYSLYNTAASECRICTRPFFHCAVEWDGSMIPCCILPAPIVYGNAAEDFNEGWNGKKRTGFLISLLKGNQHNYKACSTCSDSKYRTRETDILDGHEEELINRLERKENS